MTLLLLSVARLCLLHAVRLEVLRTRFDAGFTQVLLPAERRRNGDLQRRVLNEVLGGAVACRRHVRVHVVPMLHLALRAFRLERVKIVQVAQLEFLISSTSGVCEERSY